MSHKLKCGCVIADANDRAVKKGYELGGYVKEFCATHKREKALAAVLKEVDETVKKYTEADLAAKQVELLREIEPMLINYLLEASNPDEYMEYRVVTMDAVYEAITKVITEMVDKL
jgi:hypothetical protein